jgi:hypothetical protein
MKIYKCQRRCSQSVTVLEISKRMHIVGQDWAANCILNLLISFRKWQYGLGAIACSA